MQQPFVIVGAGHAGGRAALALREAGFGGRVLLIGEEPHLPYERPPLSKQALLEGCALPALAPAGHYAEQGIEHLAGTRVLALDTAARRLTLNAGAPLHYDRLLLATGGQPRRLAQVPAHLAGVHYLRSWGDAQRLRAALLPGARVVVVGGGFIGLEAAASARQRGCQVSVLEAGERLAARALPASASAALLALHQAAGTEVYLGASVLAVEGRRQVEAVRLADGRSLPCEVLLVGIGIAPNLALAEAAGLALGNGIRVDACLRSSAPQVFAAGDVCEFPCAHSGTWQRQETWRNAEAQGRLAALNMLGAEQAFEGLAGFWSDQYGWSLQLVGHQPGGAEVVRRRLGEGWLDAYLDSRGRLRGACAFAPGNSGAKALQLLERLILAGAAPSPAALADPATPIKQLLKEAAHA